MHWTTCNNLSDVQSFLGITGVLQSYIPNYGIRAQELQCLLWKEKPFEEGLKQIKSMELVKEGVRQVKAIKPLDYENQGTIVLIVDSSYISIGFYIYQKDLMEPKKVFYAKFAHSLQMTARHDSRSPRGNCLD